MLTQITNLITSTGSIAVLISTTLMTVAFIAFMYAVINYIIKRGRGEADGLKQAGNMLFGAVFALFVMVAIWGLVTFISRSLGVGIGGCVSRPSTLPGLDNNKDCGRSSGAGASGINNGSNGIYREGISDNNSIQVNVNGYGINNNSNTQTQPLQTINSQNITNPDAANNRAVCNSGFENGRYANNQDLLSCSFGIEGDLCQVGTCAYGYRCDLSKGGSGVNGLCVGN